MRRIGDHVAHGYQERIAGEVSQAVLAGRSGLVLAPTGSGKTNMIAMAAADARAAGRPVLILSPNVDLANQIVATLGRMPEAAGSRLNVFLSQEDTKGFKRAQAEREGGFSIVPNRLDDGRAPAPGEVSVATRAGLAEASADPRFAAHARAFGAAGGVVLDAGGPEGMVGGLNLAVNGSIRNKDQEALRAQIEAFGAAGGIVLIDEGQGAAADRIGEVMAMLARAGATCAAYSATPWRDDGRDVLAPFKEAARARAAERGEAWAEPDDLIGAAGYLEVLGTGQTVPSRFECANDWLRSRLSPGASERMDAVFDELVAEGRSPEEAAQESFSKFFKPDASESDRHIGLEMREAFGDAWERHAAGRTQAILHCDRVDTADAVTAEIASRAMPYGHPRHGAKARVAMVTGEDTRLFEDGAEVDLAAPPRGWTTPAARRKGVLDLARAKDLEALVNVNALGTGTDVPPIDLNILVAGSRNLSFLVQTLGRGARASAGKAEQLFVDLGTSLQTHWPNLKAFAQGDMDVVDPKLRRMDPRIVREMHATLGHSGDLDAQVDRELAARRRSRSDPKDEVEERVPGFDEFLAAPGRTPAPDPIEVAPGLSVASVFTRFEDVGPEGKDYESKTAFFWEGLVVVVEQPSGKANSLSTADPERARDFAAFHGIKPRKPDGRPVTPEVAGQLAARNAEDAAHAARTGRPPDAWNAPAGLAEAKAQVDARYNIGYARTEAARAIGRRLFPDQPEATHPLSAILLDRPQDMGAGRLALTRRYLELSRQVGAPVEVVATNAAGALEAKAALGDVARRTSCLASADAATAEALARSFRRGRVGGWRSDVATKLEAKSRRGGKAVPCAEGAPPNRDPASRNWMRTRLGIEPLGVQAEAQVAKLADALRRARFVHARPRIGRYADLASDPATASRALAAAGSNTVAGSGAALAGVVGVFQSALCAIPSAALGAKGDWDRGQVVRGRAAVEACAAQPGRHRLVLDQDHVRERFSGLDASRRAAALAALVQAVKEQPAPKRRKEASVRDQWRTRQGDAPARRPSRDAWAR